MNDYDALIDFIQAQQRAIPLGPGESHRDLDKYVDDKFAENVQADVAKMLSRAMKVAGLDKTLMTESTLNLPANAHKRACAATLLAMSVISDATKEDLTQHYARLLKMQTPAVVAELTSILKKGDTKRFNENGFHQLELKNFASAGTRAQQCENDVKAAYLEATRLLSNCENSFVRRVQPGLLPIQQRPFRDYFGDPRAPVDTSAIEFKNNAMRPTFNPVQQERVKVVREVLRRVVRNIVHQEVRIYFGGRGIDTGTVAYVSGDINPTKIHVGGRFFTRAQTGVNSEAGTIVHECTHTFAATRDHAYRFDGCKLLAQTNPLQALSNADSYRFFVEAAFR